MSSRFKQEVTQQQHREEEEQKGRHPYPSSSTSLVPLSHQRIIAGFSPNYRGNISLERNRSAPITDAENCSLWLTDLPADVTTHALLSSIRNAGRIYASHINPPEPHKGHHHAAAKIIFFECAAAQAFYARYLSQGHTVSGKPVRIKHNRIKTAEPGEPAFKSRVLLVTGDSRALVSAAWLTRYFASKLEFQVDEVLEREWEGRPVVEFRFGSFRCQAESAKMAVARELAPMGVVAHFAPDPCARADPAEE